METRIKERLVGAVALVAIVVIVVPELLTGPRLAAPPSPAAPAEAPTRTVSIDLAAGEKGAISRAPPPVQAAAEPAAAPAEAPAASAPALESSSAAGPAAAEAAPTGPPPKPAAPAIPKPPAAGLPSAEGRQAAQAPTAAATHAPTAAAPAAAPATAPAPPRPAAPAAGAEGWVVQLGSFASKDNAEGLARALRAKGYRAFVSEFRGSGRVLVPGARRARAGPRARRDDRRAARARGPSGLGRAPTLRNGGARRGLQATNVTCSTHVVGVGFS